MKISEEILLDYIDGNLSDDEAKQVKIILDESRKWQEIFVELKELDKLLKTTKLKSPSQEFAGKVMMSIENTGLSIKRNGLFVLILSFLTIIAASYYMSGSAIQLTGFDTDLISQQVKEYLPTNYLPQSINMKVINSTLLCGLSIFSLLVLDKAVLQPYFKNRRYYS